MFFSASVSLTFRRCFKGGDADDTGDSARSIIPPLIETAVADSVDADVVHIRFRDAVNGRDGWREYWQAFAA